MWLCAILLFLPAGLPAFAQQGGPPAVTQQPFGQKPPPKPENDPARPEPRRAPPWMFRGMVGVNGETGVAREVESPVTGFGNEALWDPLEIPPAAARAAPSGRRPAAARRKRR